MRTYHIERFGGVDGLALRTEKDPAPGPNEVVVRVRANALNHRDLNVLQGRYRVTPKSDVVPLSDGAGEVVAIGTHVTRVRVGDRVAGIFFQRWIGGRMEAEYLHSDLGGSRDGMLSELVLLDEEGVVRVPAHLSFEEAATLPCAAVTAWTALAERARVLAGETVLTMGSGGVAVFALQFARLLGARVIAMTSSTAKAQRLRALGAVDVIIYTETPEWEREVTRLTGGRGVDHVIELGGPATLARSLKCLGLGGHIVIIGVLGGAGQMLDPTLLRGKGVTLHALSVGSRQSFEAMNRAIEHHRLRPVIDRTFAFTEAGKAYQQLEGRQHFGKVVIASE
jgi:NADPH:quinone reductase-like Zn-dependent oxidoreductase